MGGWVLFLPAASRSALLSFLLAVFVLGGPTGFPFPADLTPALAGAFDGTALDGAALAGTVLAGTAFEGAAAGFGAALGASFFAGAAVFGFAGGAMTNI